MKKVWETLKLVPLSTLRGAFWISLPIQLINFLVISQIKLQPKTAIRSKLMTLKQNFAFSTFNMWKKNETYSIPEVRVDHMVQGQL